MKQRVPSIRPTICNLCNFVLKYMFSKLLHDYYNQDSHRKQVMGRFTHSLQIRIAKVGFRRQGVEIQGTGQVGKRKRLLVKKQKKTMLPTSEGGSHNVRLLPALGHVREVIKDAEYRRTFPRFCKGQFTYHIKLS